MPYRLFRKSSLMRPAVVLPTLALALLVSACAPSRIASTWSTPVGERHQYHNVLVLGIATNQRVRRAYEDTFVQELDKHGIKVRASYQVAPRQRIRSANDIRQLIGRSSADAVLLTLLVYDDPEHPQGDNAFTHVSLDTYGEIEKYYPHIHKVVTHKDYYEQKLPLHLETDLYDASSRSLVWSGRSGVLDPNSEKTTLGDVITATVQRLAFDGFLPRARHQESDATPATGGKKEATEAENPALEP